MFVLDEMSSAILVEGILFYKRERRDMDQVGYYEYSPRFSYEVTAFRSVLQLPTFQSYSSLKKYRKRWVYFKKSLRFGMFIPDPGSDFFPSRIPDPNCLHPGSRILNKEFKYFNPKIANGF